MRLAKSSRTMLPLAIWAVLASCALAQEPPKVQPNAARDQLMKQAPAKPQPPSTSKSPAPPPAKPSGPATAKAPAGAKNSTNTPAKVPVAAKDSSIAASGNPAHPPAEKPTEEKPVTRRDPFDTLLTKAHAGSAQPENLPPGKAGLIVETLRVDGVVHSPNGMIAIVSNSQQRVYFLRDGDKLYDGSVEKIALDAISFNEIGKDAFGKPLERVVTKRLYPSSGEQQ
jgi:Tfp pilus assembly protein PilP